MGQKLYPDARSIFSRAVKQSAGLFKLSKGARIVKLRKINPTTAARLVFEQGKYTLHVVETAEVRSIRDFDVKSFVQREKFDDMTEANDRFESLK
jgi:hypothetical protein